MRVSQELLDAAAAGHAVVVPSAELARALFEALEAGQRATGRGLWRTPRVLEFGAWQRELHLKALLTDAARPRVLSELEERELWRQVIEASPGAADLLDVGVVARAARRARRAMADHGIPWSELRQEPSEETRVFLDWNQGFDARCESLAAISSDSVLEWASGEVEPFVWIESPDWRPAARRWLTARTAPRAPLRRPPRAVSRVRRESPDAELAEIARWARLNLDSFSDFRAWICIPDLERRRAEVTDAFDAALAPARFELSRELPAAPYALAGGTPLADYPVVAVALAVLRASVGRVNFAAFSTLLRAPALQAGRSDVAASARLDLELRRRGPQSAPLADWLVRCEQLAPEATLPAAVQRLRQVLRLLAETRGPRRFSEWLPIWVKALEAGPWFAAAAWSSSEYQAAQRLRELFASLAAADRFFGTLSRDAALAVLGRAAHDTAFQPQTGVPPIWVSGQLYDPHLQYDGLWIATLSEERWPLPADPFALLPLRLQRAHGVAQADAAGRLQTALALQAAWQQRGGQLVFSVADAEDGRARSFSPLLPAGEALGGEAEVRAHWQAQLAAAPALERLSDERAPPFAADERTRGVATLKAQSRCPFRGFAETRLLAEPLEVPTPGFNERERGDLTHDALEQVWDAVGDSKRLAALSTESRRTLLEAAIEHALARVCARRDPGPRWRQRERERLLTLLDRWLDVELKRAPFSVENIEGELPPLELSGLTFRVRLDRADRLEDGARVLIDYKTGSVQRDWRGERPDSPQLPVYALLSPERLVAVAYGKVNAADPGFVYESERERVFSDRQRRWLDGDAPDFATQVERFRTRIAAIAAEFAAGHATVTPTLSACRSCHLHGLCRIAPDFEEGADE